MILNLIRLDCWQTFYTLNELVEFHFDEAMQLHTNHQLAGLTRLTDWPENIT